MSGSRRQRDSIAPSLFPFLAVLLCTMGSLVLILMLIVATAQADAQKIAEAVAENKEDVENLAKIAIRSYQQKLDDGRIDLEKERLVLQHFEEHIFELTDD